MKLRGMQDIYGAFEKKFSLIESIAKEIFNLFSYTRIRFPLLEKSELFERNISDSDIVRKELYSFEDRSSRQISLVPEGTAPTARLVSDNGLYNSKLFYISPFFRYDRPQKGRYRQFHQIGCELVGYSSFIADVESVVVLNEILKKVGLEVEYKVNYLGSFHVRQAYKEYLKEELYKYDLSEELKARVDSNVLRVLDTKNCSFDVKGIEDFLLKKDISIYNDILSLLSSHEIKFTKSNIVRGLDYYTGFVFEAYIKDSNIALAGGGRYDDLYSEIGKKDAPSVGFGAGIERIAESIALKEEDRFVTIAYLDYKLVNQAYLLANSLRANGIKTKFPLIERSIKKQLSKADSRYVVIVGESELKRDKYILRDMADSEQVEYTKEQLIRFFKSINL